MKYCISLIKLNDSLFKDLWHNNDKGSEATRLLPDIKFKVRKKAAIYIIAAFYSGSYNPVIIENQ